MKNNSMRSLLSLAATIALSACSAGLNGTIPTTAAGAANTLPLSGNGGGTRGARGIPVWVQIDPPTKSAKVRRGPSFISPSTKSIVIGVTPIAGEKTVTTIVNQTVKPGTEIKVQAPVGADEFFVALYDRAQKAGTPTQGQELGQAEVTRTVKPAAKNVVKFVVDGLVAGVGVSSAAQAESLLGVDKKGDPVLELVGSLPAKVILTPLDADGNPILAPGTVPATSLKPSSSASGAITVVPAGKNEFAVTGIATTVSGLYGLVASAVDGQGGSASSNLLAEQSQAIYVGYASGSGKKIVVYDASGNAIPLPSSAFSSAKHPLALAYDQDDDELFVADASGKLIAFSGDGTPSAFPAQSVPGITSVAYFNAVDSCCTPDGDYFASSNPRRIIATSSSGVTEYSPAGVQVAQASLPFTPTAVMGFTTGFQWNAPSGAAIVIGNPAGSADAYDFVSLAATGSTATLAGAPAGLAGFPGYVNSPGAESTCVVGTQIPSSTDSCFYAVSGTAANIEEIHVPWFPSGIVGPASGAAVSAAPAAITFDPATFDLAVALSDGSIAEYTITQMGSCSGNASASCTPFTIKPARSFTPPKSSSVSGPTSIAVGWNLSS